MAELLKISKNSYVRYEKGEREIPLEVGVDLADYYGISLNYLFGRTDKCL